MILDGIDCDSIDSSMSASLPSGTEAGIIEWQKNNRRQLQLSAQLTNGMTDASVLVVLVNSANESAKKLILKLIPPRENSSEPTRHLDAIDASPPDFASNHLVSQPFPPVSIGAGWTAMFQEIAGGSISKIRPLSALAGSVDLVDPAAYVADSVIQDWNTHEQVLNTTLVKFIQTHISKKLEKGSQFRSWIADQFGNDILSADGIAFMDDDSSDVLPNPLKIAVGSHTLSNRPIKSIVGLSHGDLHLENVLIPMDSGVKFRGYRLIDLSKFTLEAPLTRDPINLLLSIVAPILPDLTRTARRTLMRLILGYPVDPLPLQLSGINEVIGRIKIAGFDRMSSLGLVDEWESQQRLSLAGVGLVYASRERFTFEQRIWYIELSARAMSSYAQMHKLPVPRNFETIGTSRSERMRTAATAAEDIVRSCSAFDGRATTIAVISKLTRGGPGAINLGSSGWDVVIEFDALTDYPGGSHHALKAQGAPVRLLSIETRQPTVFGRTETMWIAADGLSIDGEALPEIQARDWRRTSLHGIEYYLGRLIAAHATPVTIVVFGDVTSKARQIVESALDLAGERLKILCANTNGVGDLSEYDALHCTGDADLIAQQMPAKALGASPRHFAPTIPSGRDGTPLLIPVRDIAWFDEVGELVHSQVGTKTDAAEQVGASFYRGRTISWFELALNMDIDRQDRAEPLKTKIVSLLQDGGTLRWTYAHAPGAGGTTIVRRVAWELHDEYPTILISGIREAKPVITRIRQLSIFAKRQILVVIENTTEVITDAIYGQLRADSVGALILLVTRGQVRGEVLSDEANRRLGYLTDIESDRFVELFSRESPSRSEALRLLSSTGSSPQLPFFFALTAFQDEYTTLDEYVQRSIDGVDLRALDVLTDLAFVHRFGGVAVPSDLFAPMLGLPRGEPVQISSGPLGLLQGVTLEEPKGSLRTTHPLIADEILKQLLTPVSRRAFDRTSWRTGLADRSRAFISRVASAYPDLVPDRMKLILERLFLYRNNRDDLGTGRESFSELVQAIPLNEARVDVLRLLAETFPDEPHYWAHYARLLSYEQREHAEARVAIDRALELESEDTALWHMSGILRRNELQTLLRSDQSGKFVGDVGPLEIQRRTDAALSDFHKAAVLEESSEYPHVAIIRLVVMVIKAAKDNHGEGTFAAFFSEPGNEYYSELFDEAEIAIDNLAEITGDDKLSVHTDDAQTSLAELYDDYGKLMEGWRAMLQRPDIIKSPIRRRLVRIIRTRNSGWRSADQASLHEAIRLLDDNLRDDPSDGRTIREWLLAARFNNARLDRAIELVSYWVQREPGREALFYDYVLSAIAAMKGRESALDDYHTKLARLRDRSQFFPGRKTSYEWFGGGEELSALVHYTDLKHWERSVDTEDPSLLMRVNCIVREIQRPAAGVLLLKSGVEAFFTPSVAGMVQGKDENQPVTALIGFSYDGLRAWSVKRRA